MLCLAVLFTGSCYLQAESNYRYVYIDLSFSPEERAGIDRGMDAWANAVGVVYDVYTANHEDLARAMRSINGSRPTYIYRADRIDDPGCLIGPNAVAVVRKFPNGSKAICMHAPYINTHPLEDEWKQVTMHEMGHVFGLPHLPEPSVMATPYNRIAPDVTRADVEFYRNIWK